MTDNDKKQCAGKTKSDKPCSLKAIPGSDFCARHQPDVQEAQSPESTPAPQSEGAEAAAELMRLLEQYPVPSNYPDPETTVYDQDKQKVKATTIDGVEVTVSFRDFNADLEKGGGLMRYGVPLFSPKARLEIIQAVSKLSGAPSDHLVRSRFSEKLFSNKNDWEHALYMTGVLIWAGEKNPPGLDFDEFPHRRQQEGGGQIETARFRKVPKKSLTTPLLDKAYAAATMEAGADLKGDERHAFFLRWADEFIAGDHSFTNGHGRTVTFDDFVIDGEPLTRDQFTELWRKHIKPTKTTRRR